MDFISCTAVDGEPFLLNISAISAVVGKEDFAIIWIGEGNRYFEVRESIETIQQRIADATPPCVIDLESEP
jgi:uncharacterized protein YlzI (FlbEa/FlbD family)